MAIATIVVKNQTALDITLLGLSVPNGIIPGSGQANLTDYNKIIDILQDVQLQALANAGDILFEVDGEDYTSGQSALMAKILVRDNRTLHVATAGGDYTSVKDAIASITDASATNPYMIRVGSGIFTEDPFTMKPYVLVVGSGFLSTILKTTDDNNHFITGAGGSKIRDVSIEGPTGTGYACIYRSDASLVPFFVFETMIRKGYYGIWCNSTSSRSLIHCITVGNWYAGTAINTFMRSTGYGNITAVNSGFMSGPSSSVVHGFYCSGANSEMTLDGCYHRNSGSTDGLFADDGAFVRANATTFSSGVNAVHIGSTGTGTTVSISGSAIKDGGFTKDLWVESSTALLAYSGTADRAKITIDPSATFTGNFTDISLTAPSVIAVGELWSGINSESIPMRTVALATDPTGWTSGGVVTRATGLAVDVTAGKGFVNTTTGVNYVEWTTATDVAISASVDFWVYVTSSGVVSIAESTEPDEETNIILAAGRTDASGIQALSVYVISVDQLPERLHEFVATTMKPVWISGGAVTKNSPTSLQVDAEGASFYVGIDILTTAPAAPITFTYWYRKLGGGWNYVTSQTSFDTAYYDDSSGTLAAMPVGEWKKDLIYVTQSGDGTEYHVIYAQETFATQLSAEEGAVPTPPTVLADHALRLFGVVVLDSDTDITSLVDHRPRFGTTGTGTTGTSVHGALSGLNADDHGQYALLAGNAARNPMTGTLDATNGGLILPSNATPAQTTEGQVIWDSDDDRLTVGTGASRKLLMNQGDSAGGDVGGTYPTSLTVTDLTMSGEVQGDVLYFNGTNWVVRHPGTSGQFFQTAGAAANPVWATPPDATYLVSGYMPYSDKHYANHAFDTGWSEGGALTYGTGLVVNVASGEGYVNDATDPTTGTAIVTWGATTVTATANSTGWVYVTSAGTVSYSATEPSVEANIILGSVQANASVLTMISNARPANILQSNGSYGEFVELVFGGIATSGLVATQNATPLHIDVTSGVYFIVGRERTATSGSNITWTYWYRDGSGGWTTVKSASAISTANYDSGTGTLTAIPAGRWKKDLMFVCDNGSGREYHVVYGQTTFPTQSEAQTGSQPEPSAALLQYAAQFAGVVVQQGAASITSFTNAKPRRGQYDTKAPEAIGVNRGDSAGGDVGGTFPTSLTVSDLTMSGEVQGDVLYFNGSNWVVLHPGTSGQSLLTQGPAANPQWGTPASAATLQSAYNAGNTIVTAGALPIQFTLTSGGFTVDGAGAVNIGATAAIQTLNFGTGGAAKTVAVGSTNGTSSLNLDAGTGAINIGSSASARAINIGTGAAVVETIAIGGTGANVITIGNTQTAGSVSIGAAMTTGTINVGGTGAQTGTIDVGVGTGAQALNVGTGAAAKTITIGNTTGATTVNLTAGTGNTNVTSAFAMNGVITPTSLSTDQNNYNPTGLSGASSIRQDATTDVTITGLVGGVAGRIIFFTNISSTYVIRLAPDSASSTAANRFLNGGADVLLPPNSTVLLRYDGTSSRWRPAGTSSNISAGLGRTQFTPFAGNAATNRGTHAVYSVGSNSTAYFEFNIPYDQSKLLAVYLLGIPGGTGTGKNIDLATNYGSLGEAYNLGSEADTTSTYDVTINVISGFALNGVLTGTKAGDMVGLRVTHNSIGITMYYMGVLFSYS